VFFEEDNSLSTTVSNPPSFLQEVDRSSSNADMRNVPNNGVLFICKFLDDE
jgi:hypothetical protein